MKTKRIALMVLAGSLTALAAHAPAEEKKTSFSKIDVMSAETSSVRSVRDLRLTRLNSDGKMGSVAEGGTLRSGDKVKVCFGVNRGGYVSLWSRNPEGVIKRNVPNKYMAAAKENGVEVSPGNYCVADNGLVDAEGQPVAPNKQRWFLKVEKTPGEEQLFLYWSARADGQPPELPYMDIDGLDEEINKKKRLGLETDSDSRSGGLVITYRVVPAVGGQ